MYNKKGGEERRETNNEQKEEENETESKQFSSTLFRRDWKTRKTKNRFQENFQQLIAW